MIYVAQDTNKICYMILPEGIKEDLTAELAKLSEKHGVSIVVIEELATRILSEYRFSLII